MRRFTLRERLRYWFDTTMGGGTFALIIWLAFISVVLVLGIAALVTLFDWAPPRGDHGKLGFWEVAWMSLLRTLDPGTMGNDVGSWPFLLSMLGVTVAGIFVVGTLIGLLTSAIDRRLEELRKGRSLVVEQDHVVLLGWSFQVHTLVRELVTANASRSYSCVAILADRDKVEMEDELRARVGPTGRTRVVCRTGVPTDRSDLRIVNPEGARAFVVLPDDSPASDARTIKTVLALSSLPRRPGGSRIVAGVHDPEQAKVARLVGGLETLIVVADELVARVIAQTARQPGLSSVYYELLDFANNDIFFVPPHGSENATFDEALTWYENAVPIGITGPDGNSRLNPAGDDRFGPDELAVVIAVDPAKIRPMFAPGSVDEDLIVEPQPHVTAADRILILNWNRRATLILRELERYAATASVVTVLTDHPDAAGEIERLAPSLKKTKVHLEVGRADRRGPLDRVGVGGHRHVMILADSDRLAAVDADSRTLVTLLHLREIARECGATFSVVAEVLDARNRDLADTALCDDTIVSDTLVSLMLAQLAENPLLTRVLDEIFDAAGCDMRLLPARDYVALGHAMPYQTAVEAARRRGHICVGYRLAAEARESAHNFGIVVNPLRSAPVTFGSNDRLIILGKHSS